LWYAQFYQNGKKVRVTTGESVKQKAFTKLRILMGKADTGEKSPIELKNTRYAELREGLLNDYDAQERRSLYTTADGETVPGLKHLDAFVGFNKDNPGPSVTALTADYADVFIKRQKGLGFSSATINRSLHCLRRMLTLAHGRGKIDRVPKFTFLKEPPARQGFLTVPQFERLLKMLPTYLRPLVQFLYWCGCRKGEALLIEWPQVNLAERLIKLEGHQTKNGEARNIPLPSCVVADLEKINPKRGKVFDATNLRVEWAKACTALGYGTMEKRKSKSGFVWYKYSGLIVHDLRRSAVRNLVAAGNPEKVAMEISGHLTREVFDRYHIVSSADVTNAMRKTESFSLGAVRKDTGDIGASLVQARPRVQNQLPGKTAETRVVIGENT